MASKLPESLSLRSAGHLAAIWLSPALLYGFVAVPLLLVWFGDAVPGSNPSLLTRIMAGAAMMVQVCAPLAYLAIYLFATVKFADRCGDLPVLVRFLIILALLVLPFAVAAAGVYAVFLAMPFWPPSSL